MDAVTIYLVFIILYIIGGIFFGYYLAATIFEKRRLKTDKNKFIKTLLEGLKSGTIDTHDDVVNIFKNVRGLNPEDIRYSYGLSRWLREFWVDLISKELDKSIDDKTLKELKFKIDEFIQKVEKISPFSDLPDKERSILTEILMDAGNNNKEAIPIKIAELASIIQTKNDHFNKIEKRNKWSTPLGILGFVATVLFGILSLRL